MSEPFWTPAEVDEEAKRLFEQHENEQAGKVRRPRLKWDDLDTDLRQLWRRYAFGTLPPR